MNGKRKYGRFRAWLCRMFGWHSYIILSIKPAEPDGLIDIVQCLCLSCGEARTHVVGSIKRTGLAMWIEEEVRKIKRLSEQTKEMLHDAEDNFKQAQQLKDQSEKELFLEEAIETAGGEMLRNQIIRARDLAWQSDDMPEKWERMRELLGPKPQDVPEDENEKVSCGGCHSKMG